MRLPLVMIVLCGAASGTAVAQEDPPPLVEPAPPVYDVPIPPAPPTSEPAASATAPAEIAPDGPPEDQNPPDAAPSNSHGAYEPLPGDELDPGLDDQAPGPRLRGVMFSLGNGVGLPFGSLSRSDSGRNLALSDLVSARYSFIFGVGYRVSDLLSLGGFLRFGVMALDSNACSSSGACSASDLLLGIEMRLHLVVDRGVSPWASIGFGYERFTLTNYGSILDFEGGELSIEIGGDFRVTRIFTLGPFVGLQMGSFYSWSGSGWDSSADGSHDITDAQRTIHGWVLLGIHGAFTL